MKEVRALVVMEGEIMRFAVVLHFDDLAGHGAALER